MTGMRFTISVDDGHPLDLRLAELLDAGPGELVTVEALDGTRRSEAVPVSVGSSMRGTLLL